MTPQEESEIFRPDWENAPEWAMFAAQDADGWWFWYSEEPVIRYTSWDIKGIEASEKAQPILRVNPNTNWRDTLEARP